MFICTHQQLHAHQFLFYFTGATAGWSEQSQLRRISHARISRRWIKGWGHTLENKHSELPLRSTRGCHFRNVLSAVRSCRWPWETSVLRTVRAACGAAQLPHSLNLAWDAAEGPAGLFTSHTGAQALQPCHLRFHWQRSWTSWHPYKLRRQNMSDFYNVECTLIDMTEL